jgi:hypothetical protein
VDIVGNKEKMNRFALIFNQTPSRRLHKIPFLMNEFDWIQFDINKFDEKKCNELNEYEAIYFYCMSGAHPKLLGGIGAHNMPVYLRTKGVTKPKFLWQMDYFQPDLYADFAYKEILPYIDIMLDCTGLWRNNPDLGDVLRHYVTYPLEILEKNRKWYEFDEKENYIVALKRFYGKPTPSIEIAEAMNANIKILGDNHPNVYGEKYTELVARAKLALDYHTSGHTWSRFGAECSLLGTPIMGPPEYTSIRVANRYFARNYNKKEIIGRIVNLLAEPEYYAYCQDMAKINIERHVDPEVCGNRYKSALRLVGINI